MPDRLRPAPVPVSGTTPESWRPLHWAVVSIALLLALWAGWHTRAPEVSIGGDEATYIILSHSIDRGHYRDEFLVGTPAHAQYPPGTSIWISAIRRVAGPDLDAVRAANVLLLALTALLLGDGVRRLAGPWAGVAATGLTALNPVLLELAGTALSEPPFLFLAIAALWSALVADGGGGRRGLPLTVTASLASFLTRTVGITVVGAVGGWLLIRRRWRAAAIHAVLSLGVIGGWFLYTLRAGATTIGHTYAQDLNQVGVGRRQVRAGLAVQALGNAKEYLIQALPDAFRLPTLAGTLIDNVLWLILLACLGATGMWIMVRRWPAAAAYAALSAAVLLIWPWPVWRLLAPVIPILVAMLMIGAAALGKRLGQPGTALLPSSLALALVCFGLPGYLRKDVNHLCGRHDPYAEAGCYPAKTRALVAAARFVRDSLPRQAVVAAGKPATIFYFSDHRTVPLQTLLRDERRTSRLEMDSRGANVLLLSQVLEREHEGMARMAERHCDQLMVRKRIEPMTLLLVPRDSTGTTPASCEAIREYLQQGL